MPEYSTIPMGLRIFVLFLIVILLLFLGIFILNSIGILDARSLLSPLYSLLNIRAETKISVDDPLLLAKQRLAKDYEAVDLMRQEIEKLEQDASSKSSEVNQQLGELSEREKQLEEREKLLNQQLKEGEDRRVRLEQMSKQFTAMPPEAAVNTMLEMDVQEVIDVLQVTEELAQKEGEESIVPHWLSLISSKDAKKAAEIQEKWR
jgi:flagellar protein FlbB